MEQAQRGAARPGSLPSLPGGDAPSLQVGFASPASTGGAEMTGTLASPPAPCLTPMMSGGGTSGLSERIGAPDDSTAAVDADDKASGLEFEAPVKGPKQVRKLFPPASWRPAGGV